MTELRIAAEPRDGGGWWEVPATEWLAAHRTALAAGYSRLEWLTGSHQGGFRLVSHLTGPEGLLVIATSLEGEVVDSVAGIFHIACFHEREVRQMFGIDFVGLADARPAFSVDFGGHPLRRDYPLEPRLKQHWPGVQDPESKSLRQVSIGSGHHEARQHCLA